MKSKEKSYRDNYWKKWAAENRPRISKTCRTCGEAFYPRGPQKVCAICQNLTCQLCQRTFRPKSGNLRQKFCSQKCQASRPENIRRLRLVRGTKPRTYHLSKRDKHGSAFDREWRNKIFERDSYTCRRCGQRGGRLQAHHIRPYTDRPDLRYVLSNGLTLCVTCHKRTETYGWQKMWKRRKEIAAKRMAQEVLDFGT